ncbi:hypothetical protein ACFFRR_003081 [Megaselia abdita]
MTNVNFNMRFDENIFLYVKCRNQSNFIKVSFRSHQGYHLDLVKEAISAAFEAFNIDDFEFYWDEVLIPEKEVVNLIRAKQFCGDFKITLRDKTPPIQENIPPITTIKSVKVDESINEPSGRRNSFDSVEESFVEEIHEFVDECVNDVSRTINETNLPIQEVSPRIISINSIKVEKSVNDLAPVVLRNGLDFIEDSLVEEINQFLDEEVDNESENITAEDVVSPVEPVQTEESHVNQEKEVRAQNSIVFNKVLRVRIPRLKLNPKPKEEKTVETEDDQHQSTSSHSSSSSSRASSEDEGETKISNEKYGAYRFGTKTCDEPNDAQITKFKEYLEANLGSAILQLGDNMTEYNRKNIFRTSVKYLFNDYGVYPSIGQKSHMIRMLVKIFKSFKGKERRLLAFLVSAIQYNREKYVRENKLKKHKSMEDDIESQEFNLNTSDEDLKVQISKFKDHCEAKLGAKVFDMDYETTLVHQPSIIRCAAKYLIDKCGIHPNDAQKRHLCRLLVEVFQPLRKVESKMLFKCVVDKVSMFRCNFKHNEKASGSKRRRLDVEDDTESQSFNKLAIGYENESDKLPLASEPFDVQVSKFKEYFDANCETKRHLLGDPLKTETRRTIITVGVKFLIDECGVLANATQRHILVRILMEVFKPFNQIKGKIVQYVGDKLRYYRIQALQKEESVANLLENAKKRKLILGGVNENDNRPFTKRIYEETSSVDKSDNLLSQPFEVEVTKFKDYFNANSKIKIELIDDPLRAETRFQIMKWAGQYILDECGMYPSIAQTGRLISILIEVFEPFKNIEDKHLQKWVKEKICNIRRQTKDKEEKLKEEELRKTRKRLNSETGMKISSLKEILNANSEMKLLLKDPLEEENRHKILKCAALYLLDECGNDPTTAQKGQLVSMLVEVIDAFKSVEKETITKWVNVKVANVRNKAVDREKIGDPTEAQITKFKDYFKANSDIKIHQIDDSMTISNRYDIIKCAAKYVIDESGLYPNIPERLIMTKILADLFKPFKQVEQNLLFKWVSDKIGNMRYEKPKPAEATSNKSNNNKQNESDTEDSEKENEDEPISNTPNKLNSKSKDSEKKKSSSHQKINEKPSEKQISKFKEYFKKSAVKSTEQQKNKANDENQNPKKRKRIESDLEDSDSDCDSEFSIRTGTDLEISDCDSELLTMRAEDQLELLKGCTEVDEIEQIQEALKDTLAQRIEQVSINVFKTYKFFSKSLDLIVYDFSLRFPSVPENAIENIQLVLDAGCSIYASETKQDLPEEDYSANIRKFFAIFHYTNKSEEEMTYTLPDMIQYFIQFSNIVDGSPSETKDYPIIVAEAHSKKDIRKYYIQVQNALIKLPEKTQFVEAFDYLVKCYYVFNFDFPKVLSVFLNFIMINIYDINVKSRFDTKRSKIENLPTRSREFWRKIKKQIF